MSPLARLVRHGHDKIASRRKEPQMQYALLIYSRPGAAVALSADEQEAFHREYMDIRKLPGIVGGAALHPVETATTVRVQDGQTLVTTARSPTPRRSSRASTCSRPMTWTGRPRSRPGSRPYASAARWRSGPSSRIHGRGPR
jgi:hypothetical protein